MIKTLLLFLLIFCYQPKNSQAKNAWVDNKEICEQTGGNWRLFADSCGSSCDNKFYIKVCSNTPSYNCECENSKCWDGNKCISDQIAQEIWQKKKELIRKARAKELKNFSLTKKKWELEVEKIKVANSKVTQLPQQTNPSIQTQPSQTNPTTPNADLKTPTTPNADLKTPTTKETKKETTQEDDLKELTKSFSDLLPKFSQDKEKEKTICEKNSGKWMEFPNGCVDSCGSKIDKKSLCTQALTFGCKCGENKCWDNQKKSCLDIEEYKKIPLTDNSLDLPGSI